MPHPRPAGAPDALSTMLRSATSEIHVEAEQRPFMQSFFAGTLPRDAYIAWLARQRHLYRALETNLESIAATAPEHGLVPRTLYRTDRIDADLDHLSGTWRSEDHLSPATRAYVACIDAAASFPPGLVAHAWLRYMGNVGGRDTLRRLAAASIAAPDDAVRGLAFTDFSAVGEIRPFFADFHAKLDALPLTDSAKVRAVAEADAGFRHNIALTDELASTFGIESPASAEDERPAR